MAQSSQERICPRQPGSMFDSDKYSHSYSSTAMRNGLSDTSFKVHHYQKPTFMSSLKNDGVLKNQHSFTMDYGTHNSLSQNFGSGTRAGGGWGEPRQNTMPDTNCGQYSFIGSIPYNPAFCKMNTTPTSSRYESTNTNFFYSPQSNIKQRIGGTSMEYEGGLKHPLSFSGENMPFQDSFKSTVPKYSNTLLGAGGPSDLHAKHCTIYNDMLLDKNLSTFRESTLYRNISECENSYHKPTDRRKMKSNETGKVRPSEQKQDDVKCCTKSCDNTASNSDSAPVKMKNNWCNIDETAEESTSDFDESELTPPEEENELNTVTDNSSNNVLSVPCFEDDESLPFNDTSISNLNKHSDTPINTSDSSGSQYKELTEQNDEKQVGHGTLPTVKTPAKWTRITQKLSAGEIKIPSLSDAQNKDKKWVRITQKSSAGEIDTQTLSDSKKEDQKWTRITQKSSAGEIDTQTLSDSKKEDQKWTRITQKSSAGEIDTQTLSDSKKEDQKWTRITQKSSAGEIDTQTLSDSKKEDQKWTRITQKSSAGEIKTQTLSDSKKEDQKWVRITQKLSAGEIETETLSDSKKENKKWTNITQKLNTGGAEKQTLSDSKKEVENSEDNIQIDNENVTPEGNPEQISRKQKQNYHKKETDLSLASLTEEILCAIKEQKSLINIDNVTSSNKEKENDIPESKSKSHLRYDLENASSEIRTISGTNRCVPKVLGKLQNVKKDSQEAMKEQITAKQPNRRTFVRTAAIFGQYPSGLEKTKDKISDASGNDQQNSLQIKEEAPHNKASGISEVTSTKTCDERRASTILLQKLRDINNYEEKEKEKSVQETMEEEQLMGGNDHITSSSSTATFTITQERWSDTKKKNISKLAWEQWCAMKREKELESKKKEVVQTKTKFEQQQKMEEEKRKKQEENQESYERWLKDKREKDKEKKRIAAKKSAEEKKKEAIEKKREQRREEFKEAFQTWLKEKEYKLLEQKHQVEEAKRKKEEEEKERKRLCEKAFEEWKIKAVDRPKPMSVKIYDPLIQRQPASSRSPMFINPKPWEGDF